MAKKKQGQAEPRQPTRRQVYVSRRDQTAQRIVLISAGVVGLAVIGVLLYGLIRSGVLAPNQAVATVNGEPISARDFRTRLRLNASLAQQQAAGADLPAGQAVPPVDAELVGESTLDEMIQEVLVRQAAEERGITVSEAELEDFVRLSLGFRPLEDSFPNPTPFPTLPPTTPTATSTLVFTLTPTATATLAEGEGEVPLLTAVPTGTPAPEEESAQVEAGEESSQPTEVPPTATVTPTPAPPTVEEEAAFREEYERRLVDWETSGLTESDARSLFEYGAISTKLFEAYGSELPTTSRQVLLAHILVETEEEAQDLLDRIKAGESFAEVAAENSVEPASAPRGGEVGWLSGQLIMFLFPGLDSEMVLDLPLEEPAGPFETPQGYELLLVYDRQDDVPLSEIEYGQLQQQEYQTYLTDLRAEAEDEIEIDENWQRFLSVLR